MTKIETELLEEWKNDCLSTRVWKAPFLFRDRGDLQGLLELITVGVPEDQKARVVDEWFEKQAALP